MKRRKVKKIISNVLIGGMILSSPLGTISTVFADQMKSEEAIVLNQPIQLGTKELDTRGASAPSGNTSVFIPDPLVRYSINTALNRNDWESYTPTIEEIASITGEFHLVGQSVDSLEGMQYLTGISKLYTTNVKFLNQDELSKIGELRQLTYLSMGNCGIKNIDFIKNLNNLTGLVLPSNAISDVSPSYSYYVSGKKKQYNFMTQKVSQTIETDQYGEVVVPEMMLTGVNGNQVTMTSLASNTVNCSYANGFFTIKNLQPGETQDFSYYFKDLSITDSGKFEGVATITVVNTLKVAEPVTVYYQDTDGNNIAEQKAFSGYVGDDYDVSTPEYKIDIPGYAYKEVQGNLTGKLTNQPQSVTYIYTKKPVKEKAKDLTVHYQDTDGNKIAEQKAFSGDIGEDYDVSTSDYKIDIPGYAYKEVQGNLTGKLTDQAQSVTYIYTKKPVKEKAKDLTVYYKDTDGNNIAEQKAFSGNVGDDYDVSTPEYKIAIPGYTYKEVQGNPTGKLTDQAQSVTYIYTKKPVKEKAKDLTVYYKDTDGNNIAEQKAFSGYVGDDYDVSTPEYKIDIPGYTYKEVQGNLTGKLTDQAQSVTYIYTKKPVKEKAEDLTVYYKDTDGNNIAEQKAFSGYVGDDYDVSTSEYKIDISGYTYKEVQGNLTGKLTNQPQSVTYINTKKPVKEKARDLTVYYQDTEGNNIAEQKAFSGNVGDDYDVSISEYKKDIPGYAYKEVQGNLTGKLTDQPQSVTYIYTKKPVKEKAKDLTVYYKDTDGNNIAKQKAFSGDIGDDYDVSTSEYKIAIPGYTYKEVQGNPTGKLTDQAQSVTYIYTKKPVKEKAKDLTIHYQDTKGNKIAEPKKYSGDIGDDYDVSTSEYKIDIPGYTYKEVQGNPTGKLTDQAQSVAYIYTKNLVSEKETTVDNAENIEKVQIKNFQKDTVHSVNKVSSSEKKVLPKTGETENKILPILGFVLLLLGLIIVKTKAKLKTKN